MFCETLAIEIETAKGGCSASPFYEEVLDFKGCQAVAELLYRLFGKERVEKELEEFLEFDFFPRSGGGIGMQRLMTALS